MTTAVIVLIFLSTEVVVYFVVFQFLAHTYLKEDATTPNQLTFTDFFKGALERGVVAYGLALGYPHTLTLFGALKLGTRLKSQSETAAFNNFFLIGNLLSILLALLYSEFLVPTSSLHVSIEAWFE